MQLTIRESNLGRRRDSEMSTSEKNNISRPSISQFESLDVSGLHKARPTTDFVTLKLWNAQTGTGERLRHVRWNAKEFLTDVGSLAIMRFYDCLCCSCEHGKIIDIHFLSVVLLESKLPLDLCCATKTGTSWGQKGHVFAMVWWGPSKPLMSSLLNVFFCSFTLFTPTRFCFFSDCRLVGEKREFVGFFIIWNQIRRLERGRLICPSMVH